MNKHYTIFLCIVISLIFILVTLGAYQNGINVGKKEVEKIDTRVTLIRVPDNVYTEVKDFSSIKYGTTETTLETEPFTYDKEDGFKPLDCALSEELQHYTYTLCKVYNVDFRLVMAFMYVESGYNAEAVSNTNDYGLMQINAISYDYLHRNLGISSLLNPYQNIHSGIFIIHTLFEKYGDATKVCMAYNHGEGSAADLWNAGIFSTEHSRRIIEKYAEYCENS